MGRTSVSVVGSVLSWAGDEAGAPSFTDIADCFRLREKEDVPGWISGVCVRELPLLFVLFALLAFNGKRSVLGPGEFVNSRGGEESARANMPISTDVSNVDLVLVRARRRRTHRKLYHRRLYILLTVCTSVKTLLQFVMLDNNINHVLLKLSTRS